MKKLYFLVITFTIFSCEENVNLITKNQIGKYKLWSEINEKIKDSLFDIKINKESRISSIITLSNLYRNKDGFGVGSNIKEIQEKYKIKSNTMKLRKSSSIIGCIGESVNYNDIIFIDSDMDKKIDFVWIQNNQNN